MPDSGLIPELCKILEVSINDLFHGKVIDKKDDVENYLLEMYKKRRK